MGDLVSGVPIFNEKEMKERLLNKSKRLSIKCGRVMSLSKGISF